MSTGAQARPPTTILHGGRVRSAADDSLPASAIAIDGETIRALGGDDEILDLAGPGTRTIDLRGRTVLPSFVDSHTHFHRAAIVRRLFLDFAALAPASIGDVVAAVAARSDGLPPGVWLQGDSLSAAALAEGRLPDRRELDAVVADRPVVLRGIGKHVVAANSVALRAAGIDRATPDPPGGRIERDADGEPTGILHERAKLRLDPSADDTVIPPLAAAERRAAVRAGFADLHRLGITTIHEMIRLPEEVADLSALYAAGELGVRTRLSYRIHETPIRLEHLTNLGIRRGFGDDWLRVLGVKISVDGWCIFRNAAVYEAYCDEPENRGLMRIEPDELTSLTGRANDAGLGIAIHAVGARAVDAGLSAFEAAGQATAGPYRLEHGHLDMDRERLRRMARLGVVWSVQPALLTAYRPDWEVGLDPARVQRIMPLADGIREGVVTIHNSDVPSGPQDPIRAIRAAVDRCSGDGGFIGPDQAVPLATAWQAWTIGPAAVAGEQGIGPLVAGNVADLVVLDRDPLASTIAEPDSPTVVATMIAGRLVYGAGELEG